MAGHLAGDFADIAGIVAGEMSFAGGISRINGQRRARGIACIDDFSSVAVNRPGGIAVFAAISKLRQSAAGGKGKRIDGLGNGDMDKDRSVRQLA